MKTKELRELSVEELASRGRDLRKEILHGRVQQAAGQLENTARLNHLRREIARVHTLLSERRLGLVRNPAKAPKPAGPKPAKTRAAAKPVAEAEDPEKPAKKRAAKKKPASAE
jgi:large subunit ribosomal protein L29